MSNDDTSRRLAVLLALSFALTIASFLVSRIVSEHAALGIREAADQIGAHTMPANDHLATVRTELRRIDTRLDTLIEPNSSKHELEEVATEIRDAQASVHQSWQAYVALPWYPGEHELIDATEVSMRALDVSLDKTLRLALGGDRAGASTEARARGRIAVVRTDEELAAASELNRRIASEAAHRIAEYRMASRTWGFVLDAISTILAAAAAYFVYRVTRRLFVLVAERVSELEHFAGRVAHDIRSPLSTVAFALELARHRPEIDPKTQSYLEKGVRTLQRVGQLVDGLLLFAMAARPPPEARSANVEAVLGGIVDDARPHAEEKGICLDYEGPANAELAVACTPGVLVSMASNLVTNAIKYIGDTPVKRVTVRAREVGRAVRIEVRDTGPGIAPELRPKLFLPYVRGADSATSGFGLGLATVRRLAEAHGGTVGTERNADVGSLFWFELPQQEEHIRGGAPPKRERRFGIRARATA